MDPNLVVLSDTELHLIEYALEGYYRADSKDASPEVRAFYARIKRVQMFRETERRTKAEIIAAEIEAKGGYRRAQGGCRYCPAAIVWITQDHSPEGVCDNHLHEPAEVSR